jgi:hypothetical protein
MSFFDKKLIDAYENEKITERMFVKTACELCDESLIAYAYRKSLQFQPCDLIKICNKDELLCNSILIRDNLQDQRYVDYHDVRYLFYHFCFTYDKNTEKILRMLMPYICKRKTRNSFAKLEDMFEINETLVRGIRYAKYAKNISAIFFLSTLIKDDIGGHISPNDILIMFGGTFQDIKNIILMYDDDMMNIGKYCDDESIEYIAVTHQAKKNLLLRGAVYANNSSRVKRLINLGAFIDNETIRYINKTKKFFL